MAFLLGNLQQLLLYHADLIKEAKKDVEDLDRDLRVYTAFLRDSTKKRRKDDSFRELVRQICDVVYKAEDIIDAFVTQAAITKSKKSWVSVFKKPVYLHDIANQVKGISKQVEMYRDKTKLDFANLNIDDGGPEEPEVTYYYCFASILFGSLCFTLDDY